MISKNNHSITLPLKKSQYVIKISLPALPSEGHSLK